MLQQKLITREEIRQYKQIAQTVNDDRLNDIILQVQLDEIRPVLGEDLFNALMQSPENYEDLLNGGTYEYSGVTYSNYGLKAVIAYYVYAYWMMFGDVTNTPFGTVTKLNGNVSQPTDYPIKKSLFTTNKNSAYNIWLNVELFLRRTNEPLYANCFCQKKTNFRISKIQ
jgi:hypothetical protein